MVISKSCDNFSYTFLGKFKHAIAHNLETYKGPLTKNVRLKPGFLDPPPPASGENNKNHTQITIESPDSADPLPLGQLDVLCEWPLGGF